MGVNVMPFFDNDTFSEQTGASESSMWAPKKASTKKDR
jgi:hypothetical protein